MMSEPSERSISITLSGVKRCSEPSMWERKRTPSSPIRLSALRLNTWYPPLSVSMGLCHPMNLCSPQHSQ